MHREISHADQAFEDESRVFLYFLTILVGGLLLAHFWPPLAGWGFDAGIFVASKMTMI